MVKIVNQPTNFEAQKGVISYSATSQLRVVSSCSGMYMQVDSCAASSPQSHMNTSTVRGQYGATISFAEKPADIDYALLLDYNAPMVTYCNCSSLISEVIA